MGKERKHNVLTSQERRQRSQSFCTSSLQSSSTTTTTQSPKLQQKQQQQLLQNCLPGVTVNQTSYLYYRNDDDDNDENNKRNNNDNNNSNSSSTNSHNRSSSHSPSTRPNYQSFQMEYYTDSSNNKPTTWDHGKTQSYDDQTNHQYLLQYQNMFLRHNNNNNNNNDFDNSYKQLDWMEEQHRQRQSWRRWRYNLLLLFLFGLWCLRSIIPHYASSSLDMTTTTDTATSTNDKEDGALDLVTKKQQGNHNKQQQHDDKDEEEEILRILTKLDEMMEGDIVLHSGKPKFQQAASSWRQVDFAMGNILAVVEAKSQQDVQHAVPLLAGLSRDYHVPLTLRSGGHSFFPSFTSPTWCTTASKINSNNNNNNQQRRGVVLSLSKLTSIQWAKSPNATNAKHQKVQPLRRNNTNSTTMQKKGEVIRTVVVEPGVTMQDLLRYALLEEGYAGVVADGARVAMGGFLLGGGYGHASRMYGLGIDNVRRLKVVSINDGSTKDVMAGDNLFWALLGSGGGNLGVVTEIEYQLYPFHQDMKLAATVQIPMMQLPTFLKRLGDQESDLAREVLVSVKAYKKPSRSVAPTTTTLTSDDSSSSVLEHRLDHTNYYNHQSPDALVENGTATVTVYWMGDSSPDRQIGMKYLKEHVMPLFHGPNPNPVITNGSLLEQPKDDDNISYFYYSWSAVTREKEQDPLWSSVWASQSWNGFLYAENNTKEVWEDIRENLSVLFRYCPNLRPRIELWGGAIADVAPNATAFPHRRALYNVGVQLFVPPPNNTSKTNNATTTTTRSPDEMFQNQAALVNDVWPSIAQYLQGVYVNYPMPSLSKEEYPQAYWGNNVKRLVDVKQQYDPFHVFSFAQSIPVLNCSTTAGHHGYHY